MADLINWNNVLSTILNLPAIKVDREKFLASVFSPFGGKREMFKDKRPFEIYSQKVIDKVAKDCIKNATWKVTSVSFLAGIPGGIGMAVAIPADVVQFYANFLVLAQKLAYLYGFPDLTDDENHLGEGAQSVLTVFVGVAMGVEAANKAVRMLAEEAAKHYARELPKMALTKTVWYPIVKQIAGLIGIKITRESIGKAAGKVIPFLGGVISGGLSYATFKPMAKKLNKNLIENHYLFLQDLA